MFWKKNPDRPRENSHLATTAWAGHSFYALSKLKTDMIISAIGVCANLPLEQTLHNQLQVQINVFLWMSLIETF